MTAVLFKAMRKVTRKGSSAEEGTNDNESLAIRKRMQTRFNLQWHISAVIRSYREARHALKKPCGHGTLTLPSKVQYGPLQYPLRSHMSDLHLFICCQLSQAYSHLLG
jgi:hypothetical protein